MQRREVWLAGLQVMCMSWLAEERVNLAVNGYVRGDLTALFIFGSERC
jgi:hypothetical protein